MKRARPRLRVAELNPNLICPQCGGYFIDATTLTECLHSFCKTCIITYLKTNKHCPVCQVLVHKTKPHLYIRSDKNLQDLVYKLVPGLYRNEMKRRRDFYSEHPDKAPTQPGEERGDENNELFNKDDQFSIALHYCNEGLKDDRVMRALPLREVKPKDEEEPMKDVRYLQCLAGVTMDILKRYIRWKFDLPSRFEVEIFHTDVSLRDELTLLDVAYIYSWKLKEPLRLNYTVYEYIVKRLKVEIPTPTSRLLELETLARNNSTSKAEPKPGTKPNTNPSIEPEHTAGGKGSDGEPMEVDEDDKPLLTSASSSPQDQAESKMELSNADSIKPLTQNVFVRSSPKTEIVKEKEDKDVAREAKQTAEVASIKQEGKTATPNKYSATAQSAGSAGGNGTPTNPGQVAPKMLTFEKTAKLTNSKSEGTGTNSKSEGTGTSATEQKTPVAGNAAKSFTSPHKAVPTAANVAKAATNSLTHSAPKIQTPGCASLSGSNASSATTESQHVLSSASLLSCNTVVTSHPVTVTFVSKASEATSTTEAALQQTGPSARPATPLRSSSHAAACSKPSTPTSSPIKSSPCKPAPLSVPKLSSVTTPASANSSNGTVPSAAAAACGASSPSPASQAASSSPSPPMASSAASVKDVQDPLQKGSDGSLQRSQPTAANKGQAVSTTQAPRPPATSQPISVTAVSVGMASKGPNVTTAVAETSTSKPDTIITTNNSDSAGKSLLGTSPAGSGAQVKPVPGVFVPSNPTPNLSAVKPGLSLLTQGAKTSNLNTQSSSVGKMAGSTSRLTVPAFTGGTISCRNGMPAVVTKPARVNNAATSVNTLLPKVHLQAPTQRTNVTKADVTSSYTASQASRSSEASMSDGGSNMPGKQTTKSTVTSPGASGPLFRPSAPPQAKPSSAQTQSVSAKQMPPSRPAVPPATKQPGRPRASNTAVAPPSPSPSRPLASSTPIPNMGRVSTPVSIPSQPTVITSQAMATNFALARRAAQEQQQYLESPYMQQLIQQQHLISMLALAKAQNSSAHMPAAMLGTFQHPVLAHLAWSQAQQLSPETVRKLQQGALDQAGSRKPAPQPPSTSMAGGKKTVEQSPRKKITDIANSLQKRASQTLSRSGSPSTSPTATATNGGKAATDLASFSDKRPRPPYAHSTSISTSSTTTITSAGSAGVKGKGEDEQPLNLVMARSNQPGSGSAKITDAHHTTVTRKS